MHPLVKSFIGILIALAGLYYALYGIPGIIKPAIQDVKVVINGAIPIVLVLLGFFIAWLYYDEWKIEKELKEEVEKEEKEAKRKKKK
ncbi:MAG: hypothetical protein QXQ14_02030 [Candidatus Aenigmatarchaeota archaeon]